MSRSAWSCQAGEWPTRRRPPFLGGPRGKGQAEPTSPVPQCPRRTRRPSRVTFAGWIAPVCVSRARNRGWEGQGHAGFPRRQPADLPISNLAFRNQPWGLGDEGTRRFCIQRGAPLLSWCPAWEVTHVGIDACRIGREPTKVGCAPREGGENVGWKTWGQILWFQSREFEGSLSFHPRPLRVLLGLAAHQEDA